MYMPALPELSVDTTGERPLAPERVMTLLTGARQSGWVAVWEGVALLVRV